MLGLRYFMLVISVLMVWEFLIKHADGKHITVTSRWQLLIASFLKKEGLSHQRQQTLPHLERFRENKPDDWCMGNVLVLIRCQ